MKPATKALAGSRYTSIGAPICCTRPSFHDDDQVRHGQRLLLIVRHDHGRHAQPLLKLPQLHLHVFAQVRVQRGKWLVQQKHLRDRWPARARWRRAGAGRPRAGGSAGPPLRQAARAASSSLARARPRPWGGPGSSGDRRRSAPRSDAGKARATGRPCRNRAFRTARRSDPHRPRTPARHLVPRARPCRRSRVVLPQPDGPSRQTKLPSGMSSAHIIDGGEIAEPFRDAFQR